MAVKKTQLYASLWASCDKLRGGMDSSEYKDYILTLLFMKYVTDKFKNKGAYEDIKVFDKAHDKDPDPEKRTGCSFDDFIALKGKKNIGEGMDKIIARLADENTDLKGVIDIAHFNDEKKLGSGKEMVDKLTDLISIFQRPELDFSKNKAEGDDIILSLRFRVFHRSLILTQKTTSTIPKRAWLMWFFHGCILQQAHILRKSYFVQNLQKVSPRGACESIRFMVYSLQHL